MTWRPVVFPIRVLASVRGARLSGALASRTRGTGSEVLLQDLNHRPPDVGNQKTSVYSFPLSRLANCAGSSATAIGSRRSTAT